MAVNISWGSAQGGSQYDAAAVDHGSGSNGDLLGAEVIWLSHDGVNPITSCKFYLGEFTGTYTGGATPSADLAEMLAWGDGLADGGPAEASEFGGFWLNMDATNTFDAVDPTYGGGEGGVNDLSVALRTGVGDSPANGVNLHVNMGAAVTATGVIANGDTDASFQVQMKVPTDESVTGIRQLDQKLRFTYTS